MRSRFQIRQAIAGYRKHVFSDGGMGGLRIDAIYFGTSDLAGPMGLPPGAAQPSLDEAIATVIRKARQRGVCVGQSAEDDVAAALKLISNGVQMIAVGGDFRLLANSVDRLNNGIRGSRS